MLSGNMGKRSRLLQGDAWDVRRGPNVCISACTTFSPSGDVVNAHLRRKAEEKRKRGKRGAVELWSRRRRAVKQASWRSRNAMQVRCRAGPARLPPGMAASRVTCSSSLLLQLAALLVWLLPTERSPESRCTFAFVCCLCHGPALFHHRHPQSTTLGHHPSTNPKHWRRAHAWSESNSRSSCNLDIVFISSSVLSIQPHPYLLH
ncbi:hypothetical protein EJ04DRAFT_118364 [Polyplosphaeria fusca]|uniref:Uncharacterized protein n=1 Tax=Polyplosphaeria fusca TaxID=682080 RepID=A0A9P4R6R0_9PLEO|nr:hypothetical protein EJ04DRAFT_118364 [Polyplosphaeria fusca]